MIVIQSIILVAVFLCAISIVWFTVVCGISPMPTSSRVKQVILELLKRYESGYRIHELGSGWGTLTSSISGAFPDAQITGYERSPVPFLCSVVVNKLFRRNNCRLKFKDFFGASCAEADTVVCYLCPGIMRRLKPKLENELRRGSLVVSSTFAVPGWQPIETVALNDLYHTKVYVYRKNEGGTSHPDPNFRH